MGITKVLNGPIRLSEDQLRMQQKFVKVYQTGRMLSLFWEKGRVRCRLFSWYFCQSKGSISLLRHCVAYFVGKCNHCWTFGQYLGLTSSSSKKLMFSNASGNVAKGCEQEMDLLKDDRF